MIRFIPLKILAIGLGLALSLAPGGATADLNLYGNWCGPGTNPNSAPPIDPLDEACMRHDACYLRAGTPSCSCDVSFMNTVRQIAYPNPDIYIKARAMSDALAMTPCDSPTGWALKQSMMWRDVAADTLSGRGTPMDVPARWLYFFSRTNPYR